MGKDVSRVTRKKILVVEDDADTRELYCELLAAEAFEILQAESGKAGLDQLHASESLEAVIIDLSLPDMSGLDFVKEVRADPRWRSLKVIVISGWDNLKAKADSVGAWAHLRKPFDLAALGRVVHSLSAAS
jgi:two-component system chemotaxis response regulator CheY